MKTLINLYIEGEIKALAKAKGINFSRLFNEILAVEVGLLSNKRLKTDKDIINDLKLDNSKLASEMIDIKKENDKLEKEIEELKAKLPIRKVLAVKS
jgi:septal ring factor EnvC (AmiA/AmiB activator)